MKDYRFIDPVTGEHVEISFFCKRWRIMNNIKISDIAEELDCSEDNIYKFEQGNNNNMSILLCYAKRGFDITKFMGVVVK